jgi:hypothetical protein
MYHEMLPGVMQLTGQMFGLGPDNRQQIFIERIFPPQESKDTTMAPKPPAEHASSRAACTH